MTEEEGRLRRRPLAWRHRGFRQLTRAWVFTNLADSALYLMLAVWVKDLTDSDSAAAMVFVALGVPALAAPFLGHLADQMSRKRLLAFTNLGIALAVLSLLFVDSASRLWLIYLVTFSYGCVGYLTASSQSGLIRDLLADDELASGNGVLSTLDQGFRLVSPLVGTALYVAVGPEAVVVLTAACFGATAMLMTRVEVDETLPADPGDQASYWAELAAGFRHLARTPTLGTLTVVLAAGFGAAGFVNAAVFPVMEQGLGVDAATLGLLVSFQGLGAVIGGATSSRLVARFGERRSVGIGMAMVTIGMIPMVGTSLAAVVVGIGVIGLGIPWILVAYSTLRQRLTPSRLQGRAAAAANVVINVPQTLAIVAAAAAIGWLDYRLIVLATIVLVAAAAVMAHPLRPEAPTVAS
jgi:predicted MFS family arabinose efflux permease